MDSPCRACGACCRLPVAFAAHELASRGGTVPDALTEPGRTDHVRMRRRNGACIALDGVVGQHTTCTIYDLRPTPCRDFEAGNPYCDLARDDVGLPSVYPDATEG